jgi:hypothetical protein
VSNKQEKKRNMTVIENCLNGFKDFKFESSNSSSESDIWQFQKIGGQTIIFCKIFEANESGLKYEGEVYAYIHKYFKIPKNDDEYKKLFIDVHCIVKYLSFSELKSFIVDKHNITSTKSLVRNLIIMQCGEPSRRPALTDSDYVLTQKDVPYCYNTKTKRIGINVRNKMYHIVMTKKPDGKVVDLFSFITSTIIEKNVKRMVLGKTLLAIQKLVDMKISHNDMHWKNILVTEHITNDTNDIYVDKNTGVVYSFGTVIIPILFDWDRSQVQGKYENASLDSFEHLYKPKYSPYRDLLTFYNMVLKFESFIFDDEVIPNLFFSSFFKDTANKTEIHEVIRHMWEFAEKTNLHYLSQFVRVDMYKILFLFGATVVKKQI